MKWRMHECITTTSTNLDAHAGAPGEVWLAQEQTAGRGRLNHRWFSPRGANLMMSAVLSCAEQTPEEVATFPLVAGLAVAHSVESLLSWIQPRIKWPNDVLVEKKKLAGILCERTPSTLIVGIGLNVNQTVFDPAIAPYATSLKKLAPQETFDVTHVAHTVLQFLGNCYETWRTQGFASLYPILTAYDDLKGQTLTIQQTDEDLHPISGLCGGIQKDGSLRVGETPIWAGEAHILKN